MTQKKLYVINLNRFLQRKREKYEWKIIWNNWDNRFKRYVK